MLSRYSERMSKIMKDARVGNNAKTNCGYLTEYALESLQRLLNGKEPIVRIASIENSANATTATHVTFKIKTENPAAEPINAVVSSTPIRADSGLHSKLPFPSHLILDVDNNVESCVIDLADDKKIIKRTRVNTPDELTLQLKIKAKAEGKIIYGDVTLSKPGSKIGHVLAFVADENDVFYIDGQLYNGITKQGNPIFTDFKTALNSENKRAFIFHGEDTLSRNKINKFQTTCFYLVYGTANRTLNSNVVIKPEPVTSSTTCSDQNSIIFNITKTMAALYSGITVEAVKALPATVTGVGIYPGVTVEVVKALPATVTRVGIGPGVTVEVVKALPATVTRVGNSQGVTVEIIKALPATVTDVGIGSGVTVEVVKALPATVIRVGICPGVTVEAVKALPATVIYAYINPGVTVEAVKALPATVIGVVIYPDVTVDLLKALPATVTDVGIGSGVTVDMVKALPATVIRVSIHPGVTVEAIKALPATVIGVVIYPDVTVDLLKALPATILEICINKSMIDKFKGSIENIYDMDWNTGRGKRRVLQTTTTITNTLNAKPVSQQKRSLERDEHTVVDSVAKISSRDKDAIIERQKNLLQTKQRENDHLKNIIFQQQQQIQALRNIADGNINQIISAPTKGMS